MHGFSYSGTTGWEAFHFHQNETKNPLVKDQNQNTGLPRPWLLVYPNEHKWTILQNDSKLTSIGNIKFDSKISIGPSRVVAGCQNDPTNGFDLSNDAGYSRGREDPILPNNQATNLREEIQTHTLTPINPELLHRKQNRQRNKEVNQKRCSLMNIHSLDYYYFITK